MTIRTVICAAALVAASTAAQAGATFDFYCTWSAQSQMPPLVFVYDEEARTATVNGNNGSSPVMPYIKPIAITFLEFLVTGVVQSTTIAVQTGEAVYSRHTVIGLNEFVASQQKGSCKITQR